MSKLPDRRTQINALFRRLGEIDWDFTAQTSDSPFSAIHWHPCRFPAQIPALAIGRLSKPGDLVLDPFMGSATTLVEAQRLGRRAIGVDINPVSCQIARGKTLAESASSIDSAATSLKLRIITSWDQLPLATLPVAVQGSKWYMPATLDGLRKLWTIVEDARGVQRSLARACFSAILLSACREDRHWGYVCDNTTPKSSRAPNARNLFCSVLDRFVAAYYGRSGNACEGFPSAQVLEGDAATVLAEIPAGKVDCVVTSPPYFGVTDYVKAQRLTLEWMSEEIEPLRRQEIGARSKRHRMAALSDYLAELDRAFRQVYRVMKSEAIAVIVFGQSRARPDAQVMFAENLAACGFVLELERERRIPVGRRQMPMLGTESILVVRKR